MIGAPKDEGEMEQMMKLALASEHVSAIRFPRANIPRAFCGQPKPSFEVGQGEVLAEGDGDELLVRRGRTLPYTSKTAKDSLSSSQRDGGGRSRRSLGAADRRPRDRLASTAASISLA